MAELLKPTDTLAQGYPKINTAIEQAEQALITSDNAIDTANSSIAVSNQALANSQSTQEQLNQIVIDGDSSVEAAQARVDIDGLAYDTLKERLDVEHQEVSSQLADISNQTHYIRPEDNPQEIFNSGNAGDKFVFVKGEHLHNPVNNNAMLYVDKSCMIELAEGAVLKIPNNSVPFEATPEVIKNFSGVVIALDDLSVGGAYNNTTAAAYAIQIDTVGSVDTFKWSRVYNGDTTVWQETGIPITGVAQVLENGITVTFGAKTGHTLNSLWLVCYGVKPHYGIRVGTGFQENYIDGVDITGKGIIDLNRNNQYQHNEYTKTLPSCVLVDGRVSNVEISSIKMINGARPIQAYGEHTGVFNLDGTVTGGVSYDVDGIVVKDTVIKDCAVGHIFGFPEHRGLVKNLSFYDNHSVNVGPLVELNHGLTGYGIENNTYNYVGKPMFSLWRHSKNGHINDNRMYGDTTGKPIITALSPGYWHKPENWIEYNNLNMNSVVIGENARASGYTNKATARGSVVGGGENNSATGNYSSIMGGVGNTASGDTSTISNGGGNNVTGNYSAVLVGVNNNVGGAHNVVTNGANNTVSGDYNMVSGAKHNINRSYCRVTGLEGSSDWINEDILASGKFSTEGDAKSSKLCMKGRSTGATYAALATNGFGITIPLNTSVAYKITCIAKNEDGTQDGMWTAQGIATRGTGNVALKGNTITKVFSDSATWDLLVEAYTASQWLHLKARGDAGQNVRWVATVELTVVKT